MKTVRNVCQLQPNALEINVGDQVEKLDQIIHDTDGHEYFGKTFITDGMKTLLTKGMARLAGKSNDSVFHLKQAMGGGKTHLMVGFGLLAKDAALRNQKIGEIPHQNGFSIAKIAAFNGRNNPHTYFWGEIERQLGKEILFREYWESGAKAPDENSWIQLFDGEDPILILLDEMPPYFHYYSTQVLGMGTVADVVTRAFSNMLTAAFKKKNVCIVVSDLEAAYDTGGKLIQRALDDATQELGRAEISITPVNQPSGFKKAFLELDKTAWYLHQTQEGRSYFDHQENLTKKLQDYAEKAPRNKVDELIRHRLVEMYEPITKEAYDKVLPLPEMDEAAAVLKSTRAMLIISPDGKVPPAIVKQFFSNLTNKNNLLVLTGEKSSMASLEWAARHVYAAAKADNEIPASHPQRKELDEKMAQYEQDFQATVLNVFDKLLFPGFQQNEDLLRSKVLDNTYPSNEKYNGERQTIKTLTSDPIKLYTQISENFDALRARAEQLLFGSQDETRKTDLIDKMRQKTQMPWLPPKGLMDSSRKHVNAEPGKIWAMDILRKDQNRKLHRWCLLKRVCRMIKALSD